MRLRNPAQIYVLAVCVCSLLAACGGSSNRGPSLHQAGQSDLPPAAAGPVQARLKARPTGFPELPFPQSVSGKPAPGRSSSYVPADLRQDGNQFSLTIPSQNTAADSSTAVLSPSVDPSSGLKGIAFAAYRFTITGYDLQPEVRYIATGGDSSPGDTFVALANWSTARWDWFQGQTDGRIILPAIEPYFDPAGQLVLVIARRGSAQLVLERVRVGFIAPQAQLVIGPPFGLAPISMNLNASNSTDADGSIVKYEFDVADDGVIDLTDTVPQVSHEFVDSGRIPVRVRVTDDEGYTGEAVADANVASEWRHTLGYEFQDRATGLAVAPNGAVWVAGFSSRSNDVMSAKTALLLLKYDARGVLQKEIRWGAERSAFCLDVAVALDGSVFAGGYLRDDALTPGDALLQKYDAEGELIWSKIVPERSGLQKLLCIGSQLYAITDSQHVCAFDLDGNPLWCKTLNHQGGGPFFAEDLAYETAIFGTDNLCVAGIRTENFDFDVYVVKVHPNGNVSGALRNSAPDDTEDQPELAVAFGLPLSSIYVAFRQLDEQGSGIILSKLSSTTAVRDHSDSLEQLYIDHSGRPAMLLHNGSASVSDIHTFNADFSTGITPIRTEPLISIYLVDAVSYPGGGTAVCGAAPLAFGQMTFGGQGSSGASVNWVADTFTSSDAALSVVELDFDGFGEEPVGVQDTGGGSFDAHVELVKLHD